MGVFFGKFDEIRGAQRLEPCLILSKSPIGQLVMTNLVLNSFAKHRYSFVSTYDFQPKESEFRDLRKMN